MVFSDFEVSADQGSPVELYEFDLGGTKFRYTNVERDFVFQSNTYAATPIRRSRVISTFDAKDSQVNIELPGNNIFARLFIGVIPGEFPEITIRQLHRADPSSEAIFVFQGFVSTVGFTEDLDKADLACRPITSASGRIIPRHTYQALCNHNLYDPNCNRDGTVSEATFEENVTVDSISGRTLTIAAGQLSTEAAAFWQAGFIQFGNEYRQIVLQPVGRVMTLDLPFLEDPTGSIVRILPGCDHIIDSDCDLVYSNTINHGGSPYVAPKNPFEGLD